MKYIVTLQGKEILKHADEASLSGNVLKKIKAGEKVKENSPTFLHLKKIGAIKIDAEDVELEEVETENGEYGFFDNVRFGLEVDVKDVTKKQLLDYISENNIADAKDIEKLTKKQIVEIIKDFN